MEGNNTVVRGQITKVKKIFPDISGKLAYEVFDFDVHTIIQGEIRKEYGAPPFCLIPCFGEVPIEAGSGGWYELTVYSMPHTDWGDGYQITDVSAISAWGADTESEDDKKAWAYLRIAMSEAEYNKLRGAKFNVLEALENRNTALLTTIKGIGERKAEKILEHYSAKYNEKDKLVRLDKYGFSDLAKAKLLKTYNTNEKLQRFCDEVDRNFYVVIDKVQGWGWSKTDAAALKMEGYSVNSKRRIQAYIRYYLNNTANTLGHSWVSRRDLFNALKAIAPELPNADLGEYVREMCDENRGELHYEKEIDRIGASNLYKIEQGIAENLIRLKNSRNYKIEGLEKSIVEQEKAKGIEFTDQQKTVMRAISDNKVTLVTAAAGCVDCDTEFFNGEQWKKISEWVPGDKVLQYNEDGTAELVIPERYIKKPSSQLWLVHCSRGVDMCVSDNHGLPYLDHKRKLVKTEFSKIKERHEKTACGFSGKFIMSFRYDGEGLPLTDWEIKMMCAVICDGSFNKDSPNSKFCRFHIKKDRKKEELRRLFAEGGVEYKESRSAAEGYTDFFVYAPIRTKVFTKEWYKASQHQLQIICDNILFWDGSERQTTKTFASNVKETAEFVQFAFSSCGYRATLQMNDRRGQKRGNYIRKSIDYWVTISNRPYASMTAHPNEKTPIVPYKPLDGFQYCFTVPSHMWVMRRNGRIMVTLNCGKTLTMLPVVQALEKMGKNVACLALSGKAASNLGDITGAKDGGYTIHRWLSAVVRSKDSGDTKDEESNIFFVENHEKPFWMRDAAKERVQNVDAVFVDEVSMIGGSVFKWLLDNIPTKAKLILIGDEGQLEAIGFANVLWDIKRSCVIPAYRLTKIMRQAAKSGIITDSLKIYNKQPFVPADLVDEVVHGELQDFKIVNRDSYDEIIGKVAEECRYWLNRGVPVEDMMVITQKRSMGKLSSVAMNNVVQRIVNGKTHPNEVTVDYYDNTPYTVVYRPNDRVMVMKNNYKLRSDQPNEDGEKVIAVFNGNIGTITNIEKNLTGSSSKKGSGTLVYEYTITIDFPQGRGYYYVGPHHNGTYGSMKEVQLGYAATCHRLQGMGIPYVFGIVDKGAYTLLTNEALYTEITRAKKYCVLVGPVSVMRQTVRRSLVRGKQTWLAELLVETNERLRGMEFPVEEEEGETEEKDSEDIFF